MTTAIAPPEAVALHVHAAPGRFASATAVALAERLDGWAAQPRTPREDHTLTPAARALAIVAAATAAALRAGARESTVTLAPDGVRAAATLALLLDGIARSHGTDRRLARLAAAWGRAWQDAAEHAEEQRPATPTGGHAATLFEEAARLALATAPSPASARSARTLAATIAEALRAGGARSVKPGAARTDARTALAAAMEFTARACSLLGDSEGARVASEWERCLHPADDIPDVLSGPGPGD